MQRHEKNHINNLDLQGYEEPHVNSIDIQRTIEDKKILQAWLDATPKQRAFVTAYLTNGNNITRAYLAAYGPQKTINAAAANGHALLNSPRTVLLVKYLSRMDLHQYVLVQKNLSAALEATLEDGSPDHNIRLKAIDMFMKANGDYINKKKVSGEVPEVHIYKTPELRVPGGKEVKVVKAKKMLGGKEVEVIEAVKEVPPKPIKEVPSKEVEPNFNSWINEKTCRGRVIRK